MSLVYFCYFTMSILSRSLKTPFSLTTKLIAMQVYDYTCANINKTSPMEGLKGFTCPWYYNSGMTDPDKLELVHIIPWTLLHDSSVFNACVLCPDCATEREKRMFENKFLLFPSEIDSGLRWEFVSPEEKNIRILCAKETRCENNASCHCKYSVLSKYNYSSWDNDDNESLAESSYSDTGIIEESEPEIISNTNTRLNIIFDPDESLPPEPDPDPDEGVYKRKRTIEYHQNEPQAKIPKYES